MRPGSICASTDQRLVFLWVGAAGQDLFEVGREQAAGDRQLFLMRHGAFQRLESAAEFRRPE